MKNKNILIISVIFTLLIALFFAGTKWFNAPVSKDSSRLISLNSLSYGNPKAKVTIVEFFDPACETCALFSPLVKELVKKHEPNLRVILRYAPFHENSISVVRMLEATRAQGKYFEALEAVFNYQRAWTINHVVYPAKVWPILEYVGVDIVALKEQMKDPKIEELIEKDIEDAKALGATKTPSFFVNGKPLESFGYEQLVKLIESELKK
ncbi:MAG: DsbA family protein [Sulfurospirillaceae bacterium]|nr:DsbA family protein [Sulfurospirillaceae bacterium]MCK9546645.1 DsbA family protein [Sulfurospirillaceae bacterium]